MAEQGCNYVPIARWRLQFSLMTKGKNDKWEKKERSTIKTVAGTKLQREIL